MQAPRIHCHRVDAELREELRRPSILFACSEKNRVAQLHGITKSFGERAEKRAESVELLRAEPRWKLEDERAELRSEGRDAIDECVDVLARVREQFLVRNLLWEFETEPEV